MFTMTTRARAAAVFFGTIVLTTMPGCVFDHIHEELQVTNAHLAKISARLGEIDEHLAQTDEKLASTNESLESLRKTIGNIDSVMPFIHFSDDDENEADVAGEDATDTAKPDAPAP